MTEVYWMALAHDVPFTKFAADPLISAAAGIDWPNVPRA